MRLPVIGAAVAVLATAPLFAACNDAQLRGGYPRLAVDNSLITVAGHLNCAGTSVKTYTDSVKRPLEDRIYAGTAVTIMATFLNGHLKEWSAINLTPVAPIPAAATVWDSVLRSLFIPLLATSDPVNDGVTYTRNVTFSLSLTGDWAKTGSTPYDPANDGSLTIDANTPSLNLATQRLTIPSFVSKGVQHNLTSILLASDGTYTVTGDGAISDPFVDIIPEKVNSTWSPTTRKLSLPILAIADTSKGFQSPSYFTNVNLTLDDVGYWTLTSAQAYVATRDGAIRNYGTIPGYDTQSQLLTVPILDVAGSSQASNIVLSIRGDSAWKTVAGDGTNVPGSTVVNAGLGKLLTSSNVLNYAGVKQGTILTLTNNATFQVTGSCAIPASQDTVPATPLTPAQAAVPPTPAIGIPGTVSYVAATPGTPAIPAVYGPPRIPAFPLASAYRTGLSNIVITIQGDDSACNAVQLY